MDETVIGEIVKFVLAPSCHISHSFLSQFYWLLFIVALWFIEGVHMSFKHVKLGEMWGFASSICHFSLLVWLVANIQVNQSKE